MNNNTHSGARHREFQDNYHAFSIKFIIILLFAVVVIVTALLIIYKRSADTGIDEDVDMGLAYIRNLEERDTSEIEERIKKLKRQERKNSLMEDEDVNIWEMFTDTVIIGDSRAEGFSGYEFLDKNLVLAEIGYGINNALTYLDRLTVLNPSNVVIIYGLNDIEGDTDCDHYLEKMSNVIERIRAAVPGVTVYINSIIPTTTAASNRISAYAMIPEWNDQIKAYCDDNQIPFIDITDTVEEYSDLYESDGIHMNSNFYEHWAYDIILEIIDNED